MKDVQELAAPVDGGRVPASAPLCVPQHSHVDFVSTCNPPARTQYTAMVNWMHGFFNAWPCSHKILSLTKDEKARDSLLGSLPHV